MNMEQDLKMNIAKLFSYTKHCECETAESKEARRTITNHIVGIIVCVLAIALLSIPLINLCIGIKNNSDTLGQYDTYVIGTMILQGTQFEDRIDNKGTIYPYNIYETDFKYEYNGKSYELIDYQKSGEKRYYFKEYEAVKIKSDNPEQAVIACKYDNTMKWIEAVCLLGIEIIAVLFLCYSIKLFLQKNK